MISIKCIVLLAHTESVRIAFHFTKRNANGLLSTLLPIIPVPYDKNNCGCVLLYKPYQKELLVWLSIDQIEEVNLLNVLRHQSQFRRIVASKNRTVRAAE
jgi:hypothetical protein